MKKQMKIYPSIKAGDTVTCKDSKEALKLAKILDEEGHTTEVIKNRVFVLGGTNESDNHSKRN